MIRGLVIGSLLLTGQLLCQIVELPPMVVTADRLSESEPEEGAEGILLEGSAIVLDEELLQNSSNSSLSEVLQTRAGVSFDSFFGNSSLAAPQLRGFGENSQLRTLVTVDGIPVNRNDLALVPWSRFPLGDLEKVTVLRGGRSVRYGSGAVAGVIALETKRSDVPFGGSLEIAGGSFESFRQRLQLRGTTQGWGWTTQVDNSVDDGYRENSRQESTSGSVSILTPEAEWGENRITVSVTRSQFEDPGALSDLQFLEDPRQSVQTDQKLEIDTISVGDQLEINLGPEWQLKVKGSGIETDRSSDFQGRISEGDYRSLGGEAVLSRSGEVWSLEMGARYQYSDLDFELTQPFGFSTDQQLAELSRETLGGFLITRWKPIKALTFSAGASWDRYRLDGEARSPNMATNPRRNFSDNTSDSDYAFEFGAEYQVTDTVKVWARYDRSLRFPVLDEVAFFQGFESEVPFNADLKPERGQGAEVGVVVSDESKWKVSATFFGQWLEDEIFFDVAANLNDNLSDTERLGMEWELEWNSDHWSFNLFYAATLARFQSGIDEGKRVPLVPRQSISGTLTWHLFESLDLAVEASYLSGRLDGNDRGGTAELFGLEDGAFPEIPARTVWNASANWEVSEHLSVFCRVNNLFDEEYISTQFSGGIYPGIGRQVLFGGRVRF